MFVKFRVSMSIYAANLPTMLLANVNLLKFLFPFLPSQKNFAANSSAIRYTKILLVALRT